MAYLEAVLKSGWLTTASKAQEFEAKFSDWVGARYACALNSCTAALHLGMESLGIEAGDQVLVQSMTFTASAEVVRYLGADPVFLDCDYGTRLLTPEIVAAGLRQNPRAKALVVVHFGGHPAQMTDNENSEGILSICRRQGVKIIEDAAHAFPARLGGRHIGSFGDVTCFSFYANKTVTAGEGGMLVTNNKDIFQRVKTMRLHGINRDVWDRFTANKPGWEYDVVAPGFKYNMPDVNAAIGLAQLERAEEFRMQRERCARFYDKHLAGINCIDLPWRFCAYSDHSWHLYPVVIKDNAPIDRNTFIKKLSQAGIGTSVHYKPLHRMTYYKERYNLNPEDYPNTEIIWKGIVSLPIYPILSDTELSYIIEKIHELLSS
ncbi:MAG: DegT/DnrJ/EryC1/StrS family aminotransferase [Desulfobacterales bacterium]|nr:DegT/DnrJ/EryC1/StrS family aminotransferase [Desulfobacterales bacterium]